MEWSKDSRLNMVEAMCSIDWRPVVAPSRPGWRPAMVTLTLPRDWTAVAPTAAAFKKLVFSFWKRWERKWGRPECVWKLEFQRRGAPHLHIYTAVPPGREFQEWLSMTWTAAVFGLPRFGPRKGERSWSEFCDRVYRLDGKAIGDHLRAGTGIDWREGIQASDPKRLAVYFLKRAAGHNLGIDKEYQHRVPVQWQAAGGAGRFWGVKGLARASVEVQIDEAEFVAMRRTLRRWAKANGRPVRSLAGGVGSGGMVLANDAPNLLAQAVSPGDTGSLALVDIRCGPRARATKDPPHDRDGPPGFVALPAPAR